MTQESNKTSVKFVAEQPGKLFEFLMHEQPKKSRNKVKSQLAHRQVSVNNVVTTKHDAELKPGDTVTIISGRAPEAFRHPMLRIVFEDDHIIVAEKRNGLLTVGTDKERTRTAYYLMSEHVKRSDPSNRIFIVHRLDRETSGLLVFAKSEEIQSTMQRTWKKTVLSRKYVAVCEGRPPEEEGTIDAPLAQNKNLKVYVAPDGEPAATRYRILGGRNGYTLLELSLDTGKKNQIRAHLEHVGCPIAGDKKYGAQTNPAGRVCLHAMVLDFIHPVTGEEMRFSTPVPQLFLYALDGRPGRPKTPHTMTRRSSAVGKASGAKSRNSARTHAPKRKYDK